MVSARAAAAKIVSGRRPEGAGPKSESVSVLVRTRLNTGQLAGLAIGFIIGFMAGLTIEYVPTMSAEPEPSAAELPL